MIFKKECDLDQKLEIGKKSKKAPCESIPPVIKTVRKVGSSQFTEGDQSHHFPIKSESFCFNSTKSYVKISSSLM